MPGCPPYARLRLAPLLLALLSACGGDSRTGQYVGDLVTATDFEQLAGWGAADASALTREQARSGRVATFVGPGRETSLTYRLPLRLASVHALKAVELTAWVYRATPQATAALVVQVLPPGGGPALSDEQVAVAEQAPAAGRWQAVHHTFVLPTAPPWGSELRIFLRRGPEAAGTVYLDDLTAKARE